MELRQLRYFVAAAESLSFTKAAEACYVTQATLSQQVRQLELGLGVDLFVRRNNALELTPKGEELLRDARAILGQVDMAMDRLTGATPERHLALGFYGNALDTGLGNLVREHARLRPGLRFSMHEGFPEDLARLMSAGRLDCAITGYSPELYGEDEFDSVMITSSRYVLLAAEGVVGAEPGGVVSLEDDVPIPVATLSSLQGERLSSYIRDRGLGPDEPGGVQTPANTYQGLMALVQGGQFAVLGPESAFTGLPGVSAYQIADFDLEVSSHLVWPRFSANPELPRFVQTCRAWAEGLKRPEARRHQRSGQP